MTTNSFLTGEYLQKVPLWHTEDSPWKAKGILRMLRHNRLTPRIIGEVGCGTGEVLRQLQLQMDHECRFFGYDISPQAIEISRSRENESLQCQLADVCKENGAHFDLLLVLDVLEHQENYFSFLRDIRPLAPYKLFHTVLELSARSVLRKGGLLEGRWTCDDLHCFAKDTVLQAMAYEGYEILDWFYVPRAIYRASGLTSKIRQVPRIVCFALDQDFAVRLLGGYSLFVLTK